MAIPSEMLLYPELLSNEQLIFIIQERHLHIENIERMSRCELIELFRNYCVPYGQRKYRDSGRGKVLNKTRHCSPEPAAKTNIFYSNQCNLVTRLNCDRLKPPPDILSGHMKRIKIDSLVCAANTSKRKMSIDSDTVHLNSPPPKKKKPITWP